MTIRKPTCGDFALSPMIYFFAFTVSLHRKSSSFHLFMLMKWRGEEEQPSLFFFFLFALSGGNEALSDGDSYFSPVHNSEVDQV